MTRSHYVLTQQEPQEPWSLISLMVGQLGHCFRESKVSGKSISAAKSTLQGRKKAGLLWPLKVTWSRSARYLPTEGEQTLLKPSGQISSSSSALSFKDYNLHGHSSSWQDAPTVRVVMH